MRCMKTKEFQICSRKHLAQATCFTTMKCNVYNQLNKKIKVEKDADLVQVIDTVQTADYKPINTKSNVNNTSTTGTEKLQQSSIKAGA